MCTARDAKEKVSDTGPSMSRLLLYQKRPTPGLSNKAEYENYTKEKANRRGNGSNRKMLEDPGKERDRNRVQKDRSD